MISSSLIRSFTFLLAFSILEKRAELSEASDDRRHNCNSLIIRFVSIILSSSFESVSMMNSSIGEFLFPNFLFSRGKIFWSVDLNLLAPIYLLYRMDIAEFSRFVESEKSIETAKSLINLISGKLYE